MGLLIFLNKFLNARFPTVYGWHLFIFSTVVLAVCSGLWCYLIRHEVGFHTTFMTRGFPNKYVVFVDPWTAPFFNTMVLISSGFSLTYAHVCLIIGAYDRCVCRILSCLAQGIPFTWYQWKEYLTA